MNKVAVLPDDAPHILLVDDDNRIRTLLSRYLGEHGYRVTTAEHAASARQRIEANYTLQHHADRLAEVCLRLAGKAA